MRRKPAASGTVRTKGSASATPGSNSPARAPAFQPRESLADGPLTLYEAVDLSFKALDDLDERDSRRLANRSPDRTAVDQISHKRRERWGYGGDSRHEDFSTHR
jgi:hypothetical protein